MRRTYYRFRVSTPQDSVDMMTCHVKTNYKKPLRENICSSSHAPDKRLITPLQICDIIILYRACVSAYKVCVLARVVVVVLAFVYSPRDKRIDLGTSVGNRTKKLFAHVCVVYSMGTTDKIKKLYVRRRRLLCRYARARVANFPQRTCDRNFYFILRRSREHVLCLSFNHYHGRSTISAASNRHKKPMKDHVFWRSEAY